MSKDIRRPDDWARYVGISGDIEALHTRKEQVAYILNRYPETRNSDKELWLRFLEAFHGVDPKVVSLSASARPDLPSQTVVTRARAELQNRYSLYLPTQPEVLRQRRRLQDANEIVFRVLDEEDEDSFNETYLYVDESGVTDRFLVYAAFSFLQGKDLFDWTQSVLAGTSGSNQPYFHFKNLRSSHLAAYKQFVAAALERPSARAYIHIFDTRDATGPQRDILSRAHEITVLGTAADLLRTGVIDEGRRIKVIPDRSQDQLFYTRLQLGLEPEFASRHLRLVAIEPTGSKQSPTIQLADILASSVGRRLNHAGTHVKDDFANYVLSLVGISNPLSPGLYKNVVIMNHSSEQLQEK